MNETEQLLAAVADFLKSVLGDGQGFGSDRPCADLSAVDGSRVRVIAPPLEFFRKS